MNLVSIIVPAYNAEAYLRNCVTSILEQTYKNWELILINDGSSDLTCAICKQYAEIDPRVRVIHQLNQGQAAARNNALNLATGDYILFIDSDDYIHKDTLNDIIKIAIETDADIVQFSYLSGKSRIFPSIKKANRIHLYDNRSIFYSKPYNVILWGKLYKIKLWDGIRMPIGKRNYEDDATTWKLYYSSKIIAFVDTPYYYYTTNPNSTMALQRKETSISFIYAYEERIEFFKNVNDKLLLTLSKWRFCLPLMLSFVRGNVKKEELPILLKHFQKNIPEVLSCSKVPKIHKLFFVMFSLFPRFWRFAFLTLIKA